MGISGLVRFFISLSVIFTTFACWAQVGIFQGTFDPPHSSHEAIARNAIKSGGLKIIYITAMPDSPGKPNATAYEIRQQMVEAHFGDWVKFRTMDAEMVEAFKEGYVDGLFQLLQRRHPNDKLYHVIGSDSVTRFPETQRANHRANIGTLLNMRDPNDFIPEDLLRSPEFKVISENKVQVSSTEIRNALFKGEPHWAISKPVTELINHYELYRPLSCKRVFGF